MKMSTQLAAAKVTHAVIEGDNLDLAYPPPWEHRLAERNLASVCSIGDLVTALGGRPRVFAVLLTAGDDTIRVRLAQRESGSALDEHVDRSRRAALRLEKNAPEWVVRIDTDGRTVVSVAEELVQLTGWR